MSLINPRPSLLRAQCEGFAIGAFNAITLEQMQAIVRAAQFEHAPAIIQISHLASTQVELFRYRLNRDATSNKLTARVSNDRLKALSLSCR
jgi:fructose/tagatose bisphosphate aldolase